MLNKQEAGTVAVDTKPQVCHTNVVYTRRQKRLLPEADNLRLLLRPDGQMACIDRTCLGHTALAFGGHHDVVFKRVVKLSTTGCKGMLGNTETMTFGMVWP